MSRPLIADPRRISEASAFHRAVFDLFGGPKKVCALCDKPGATDAAHVISRSKLGPLRYADPRLARPAHRTCHMQQERNEIDFHIGIRRDATRAHNALAKQKLEMP